jgi:transcriptional regulator with XRE-family HTH domain
VIDSFQETLRALGARARALRLIREWSQAELASRAGIGVATVQRFEKTGTASLENLVRIASALQATAGFDRLFEAPRYASLDDALARPQLTARQRAPRRR